MTRPSHPAPRSAPVSSTVTRAGGSPSHRPAGVILAAAVLSFTGCAALEAALGPAAAPVASAIGQGIAAEIQAEAQKQGIAANDPTLRAMLTEAEAMDAEQAKQAKALLARQTAILKELKRQRVACPSPSPIDAGAPPPDAGSPVTVVTLPQAPAVLPVVDAGREGGS